MSIWYVVAAKNESISPLSEVLVRGRLSTRAPGNVGSQATRFSEKPKEVLVEPVETKVHGDRVA